MGAGVGYKHEVGTSAQLVVGATQPDTILFKQTVERVAPLDQFGSVESPLLDARSSSARSKFSHNQRFGPKDKNRSRDQSGALWRGLCAARRRERA